MSERQDATTPTPLLEWLAATTGALLALGIISYLAWQGFTRSDTPADLIVRIETIEAAGAGFRVVLSIENLGDEAVADARVTGRSTPGNEAGEVVFDFVPGHSSRGGTLLFREKPDPDGLDLRVVGYREP